MTSNDWIVYMVFVVGFALTPGPNLMLYLTHTFEYGRRAGWATVAGISSAFLFHITATVLGLSALLLSVPEALQILRYIGVAYLLFLAWKNLKTVNWSTAQEEKESLSYWQFYWKGLLGNLLNPGTVLLYFSLIPQFLHPDQQHIIKQNLALCGMQVLGSTITNTTIVFVAGFAADALMMNGKYQRNIRIAMSLLIVVFALKMLFWR